MAKRSGDEETVTAFDDNNVGATLQRGLGLSIKAPKRLRPTGGVGADVSSQLRSEHASLSDGTSSPNYVPRRNDHRSHLVLIDPVDDQLDKLTLHVQSWTMFKTRGKKSKAN